MMFSLIPFNNDAFKRVTITAAWSSKFDILGLLIADVKGNFDKLKLDFTVSCFL